MELEKKEKELIRYLLEKELKQVDEAEEEIRPNVSFLAAEERYEIFIRDLLKKFR